MPERDTPKITQAMIDAYDEYTHLTLDRRGFMRRLTALAGSAAAAATIVPLIEASAAKAAISDPQDDRLSAVWATFTAAGTELKCYVVKPEEGERFPSVLLIHENRGLNAAYRGRRAASRARRLLRSCARLPLVQGRNAGERGRGAQAHR